MCVYIVYTVTIRYIQLKERVRMEIYISNTGDVPIYAQITDQIKEKIMSGELKEGDALPSIRFLAKELRISVITTKRAYDDLEQAGFIYTLPGKGSYVAAQNKELLREESLRKIELLFSQAVDMARISGISYQELLNALQLLMEGDDLHG